MKRPVIVAAARTPIGRSHKEKGVFRDVRSDDLAVAVIKALVVRSGIDPNEIEDVVLGNTQQQGEQGLNVARSVALMAGLADARRRRDDQPAVRIEFAGAEPGGPFDHRRR